MAYRNIAHIIQVMQRKEYWLQLLQQFIPIIASLAVGSGFTAALAYFEKHLPSLLHTILLYIIWVTIVAIFLGVVYEVIISHWVNKACNSVRNRKQYSANRKLVKEWHEKWRELSRLISKVIEGAWQPTDEQKHTYTELHWWFIKNRGRFLPLWHSFNRGRRSAAHESEHRGQFTFVREVLVDNSDDPFSYFYEPLLIEELSQAISNRRYDDIAYIFVKLKELLDELIEWSKT